MKISCNCIIQARQGHTTITASSNLTQATESLREHGYCLLRGFDIDLAIFSELSHALCSTVTLDPARQSNNKSVQKVDAGTEAIGLHVENGNTARIPELVAFYCATAAREGSQTTLCDGAKLLSSLNESTRQRLQQTLTVQRRVPEELWKSYLANEHPALSCASQVKAEHLEQMLAAVPGQQGCINADGSLSYSVTVNPILTSNLGRRAAFANAMLGPSFNYEPPRYTFADGSEIDDQFKVKTSALAETHTVEIDWRDGDVALIDNHRVMHGRRAIIDAARRELYIAMGNR